MFELFKDHLFEAILEKMGAEFDSHDFIFEMMRHYPREYTNALYECRRSKDPIQTLHAKIGKKLVEFTGRIEKTKRKASRNARNLHSRNQFWKKVDRDDS